MAAATKAKTTKTKTKAPKKEKAAPSSDPVTRKFKDYTIVKKRSGRFEVMAQNGKNVNGLDKAKVLVEAKLIKTGLSKKAPEAAVEETPAT